MGFSNEETGGSMKFANFKEGKIVTKIDGEKKTFTTLTGYIVDIDIVDAQYGGKDYRKIVLFVAHEDGVTQLGFPLSSGYGWGFFQMCGNINPYNEVSISGGIKDHPNDKTKKISSMFLSQDGTSLKHLMKKDSEGAKKIPEVTAILDKRGKEIGRDYNERDAYMEKVITHFYTNKVQKAFPDGAAAFKRDKHVDAESEPIETDLPF